MTNDEFKIFATGLTSTWRYGRYELEAIHAGLSGYTLDETEERLRVYILEHDSSDHRGKPSVKALLFTLRGHARTNTVDEPDDWKRYDLWKFERAVKHGEINAVKPRAGGPALRIYSFRCDPPRERTMLIELCPVGETPDPKHRDIRRVSDVLAECETCLIPA